MTAASMTPFNIIVKGFKSISGLAAYLLHIADISRFFTLNVSIAVSIGESSILLKKKRTLNWLAGKPTNLEGLYPTTFFIAISLG